jgi:hypothetical protein
MIIPTQYIPIKANKPEPLKRNSITLDKSESRKNTSTQDYNAHVIVYEKREGKERRKSNIKPLLDTRVGRDRRHDKDNPGIDITA